MNIDQPIRTPHNTMPITLALRSLDRKVWRDQYCIECGHPFIAISDKYIAIIDAAIPINLLRGRERVIEARCKNHYCKQFYNLYV
jgi:hypothetical protein